MQVKHLSLTNFRNYARLELDLPPHPTVIQGDNAQGKTNLLEGIYMLATTRSHRAGTERELINWGAAREGQPWARIAALVERAGGPLQVEIALSAAEASAIPGHGRGGEAALGQVQKRIRINGLRRRALELVGQVNVVMFSSDDIAVIGGAPSLRRRYLNLTISQVDRRYLRTLQRYARVLSQRNHLLRLIREGRATPHELEFWDRELVENGAYLTVERHRAVASLEGLARRIHQSLTAGREELALIYLASAAQGPAEPAAVAQRLSQRLNAARDREVAAGTSLVGPHRDDLRFLGNGVDMGIYGSRGQQRTIALSLKLAEAEFMLSRSGEPPVLLLDDVLSELDKPRRGHLFSALASYQQVLITTTDLDPFEAEFLAQATVLRVTEGRVERLGSG